MPKSNKSDQVVNSVNASQVKKVRKQRKKKDKNEPSRNKNAYMFFVAERRGSVAKEQPNLKVTEIAKELGRMWRSLGIMEKSPYEKMAADDKVRYKREMESYTRPEKLG